MLDMCRALKMLESKLLGFVEDHKALYAVQNLTEDETNLLNKTIIALKFCDMGNEIWLSLNLMSESLWGL